MEPDEKSLESQSSNFTMRELIDQLQGAEDYRDQIVPNGHHTFSEHVAEYGKLQ
jgi:hypothetical protein